MELLFLGTSSGAPTKMRNVSAIALMESSGKAWHLIDCGEGTQHQILNSSLSLNSLSTIFITHLHGDHCYGLPGLLASAGLSGRTAPLKIISPKGTKEWIELTQRISALYLPYELEFVSPENVNATCFGQFSVRSFPLSHRILSFGFSFTEESVQPTLNVEKLQRTGLPKGPLWGAIRSGNTIEFEGELYRANEYCEATRRPRKIIICGDNDQPDLLEAECVDCDVLIHESTYAEDMRDRAKSVGHCYASLIASFAERLDVANLVLTHISARYNDGTVLENEARLEYSGNLFIAKDFDRFKLGKTGLIELVAPKSA